MRRALELAEKGRGRVNPNPMVGCVLAKGGRILAEGYHPTFGGPHAEAVALQKAREKARGSELYVTLEPCNHWGKTPPCTESILRAKVKKVLAATRDTNPNVPGRGTEKLRSRGISVKIGLLEKESCELNRAYFTWVQKQRPYIILKAASTLDGKIATKTGDSKWITSPQAREYVHRLRTQVDAVLIGIETVLKDDPELTSHGKGKNPLRIVLDAGLRIPRRAKILREGARTLIVTSSDRLSLAPKRFENPNVFTLGLSHKNGRINLKQLSKELAKMNISQLLVEGGGEVNASFLKEGLVDEALFFISPKIFGGISAKTAVEGDGIRLVREAIPLRSGRWQTLGEDLLYRGYLN